jgi:flagellin-like hook-associated protein FlgL
MGDVTLSAGIRNSLYALQTTRRQMDVAQLRLATARKVNSALDNPTSFFTSEALRHRASDFTNLLTGMDTAQNTVKAATVGLEAIGKLLDQARAVANSAMQSADTLVTVTGSNSAALSSSTQIASAAGAADQLKAGDTIQINDGTTTATYTAADGDTVQTFLDTVNNTAGLKVQASLNGNGQVTLSATSNVDVQITSSTSGAGSLSSVLALSDGTTAYQTNSVRAGLASQFDALRSQIDQLARDAGYNGVNLLAGDTLTVAFNESGSARATFTGANISASGLGVGAASNQFQTDADVNAALSGISSAVSSVRSFAAQFATNTAVVSMRADFTRSMINTLNAGADDLVAADINEEAAVLMALRSRQDMATLGLSITRGSETAALRLLGG